MRFLLFPVILSVVASFSVSSFADKCANFSGRYHVPAVNYKLSPGYIATNLLEGTLVISQKDCQSITFHMIGEAPETFEVGVVRPQGSLSGANISEVVDFSGKTMDTTYYVKDSSGKDVMALATRVNKMKNGDLQNDSMLLSASDGKFETHSYVDIRQ